MESSALLSRPLVSSAPSALPRPIVFRTRGRRHGPIVRLVSPSDVGELIKPFVFLDQVDIDASDQPGFGFHPHSGIATLTLLLEGGFTYEDSTGASGTMSRGAVEWMQAGGGVWHRGDAVGQRIKGYQLWLALPPALENAPAVSAYLESAQFATSGPARVILGTWKGVRSPIDGPPSMNYLDVRLVAGEAWCYDPPEGHDVAWIAVHEGTVSTPEKVAAGELVVFAREATSIMFEAATDCAFVLGSAVRHPHELVMGRYSVHTSVAALRDGENRIEAIGASLRRLDRM